MIKQKHLNVAIPRFKYPVLSLFIVSAKSMWGPRIKNQCNHPYVDTTFSYTHYLKLLKIVFHCLDMYPPHP